MAKVVETVVNANDISRISAGTCIKGDMSSNGDIRIDGNFEGKLYSKGKVVVGENAHVKGAIFSAVVDFWGEMEGDFYVKDTLSLKNTAKVNGDLHVRRLQVDLEAQINGSCSMISENDYDKFVGQLVEVKIDSAKKAE